MNIPAAVQELIDGSGNTFHAKVARWFASDGWDISIGPYYMDQSQQKARELDLIVEKAKPFNDSWGRFKGEVTVRLFIECKFLPTHSVFWFIDKDKASIAQMLVSTGRYRENNFYTEKHHYVASGSRVAKLFASSNSRGQEAEPFYKALNQSLNGLVSMRSQPSRAALSRPHGGERITLDFPVVVCSSFSQVYAADFTGSTETTLVQDNFQLEVQYAYVDSGGRSRNELFILDIVEYDRLPLLVKAVGEDATIAGFFANGD